MGKSKHQIAQIDIQELRQLAVIIAKASIVNIQTNGNPQVQIHIDQASSKVLDLIMTAKQQS